MTVAEASPRRTSTRCAAPDVYLAAARGLGVESTACLVVEDSVTGVTAATAAGMTAQGLIGGGHASDAQIGALRAAGAMQCSTI